MTNLFPIPGSRKRFQRVGRGISAGQGKSCGRGMRGQKSRKGEGKGVRVGFEGGQTPLYRRLPKYPGRTQNYHRSPKYILLKLSSLNQFSDGETIDLLKLTESGLLGKQPKNSRAYKVVGDSVPLIRKNLIVRAHAFTSGVSKQIEDNGGTCIVMSQTAKGLTAAEAEERRQQIAVSNFDRLQKLRALKAERTVKA